MILTVIFSNEALSWLYLLTLTTTWLHITEAKLPP